LIAKENAGGMTRNATDYPDKPSRPRHRRWPWFVLAILVLLVAGELGARAWFGLSKPEQPNDIPRLYQPHPYRVYMLRAGARSTDGHVSIDSQGFRGPEITREKPSGTVRIACFGGSTTYNDTATTDAHTWPAYMGRFLQEHFAEAGGASPRIETINAGTPGYTSLESLIYLESWVLDYSPDIAIFHHGLNDAVFMVYFRDFASDYTHARTVFPVLRPGLWERSALLSVLLPAERSIANPFRPNPSVTLADLTLTKPERLKIGEDEQRACFKMKRIDTFERNLRNFIYVCRAFDVMPVLSTMVCSPEAGFFAEVVERINERIRGVAVRLEVPVIDYAAQMPWSTEAFVDRVHLRDGPEGLERKGEIFAQGVIDNHLVEQAVSGNTGEESDRP
jgi:hypothetical protein